MARPWLETIDTSKLIQKISGDWYIGEETQNIIFAELAEQRPIPRESAGRISKIGISMVSTFVAKKSFDNFVVPPFAAHWGVVVDFDEQTRFLYHLLFAVETRELTFKAASWESKSSNHIIQIGTTLYGIGEVYRMGLQLSAAFKELGSYHFAFWNCQLFAKLFLKLICQDADAVNFGPLASTEASRPVLCAIIIPSPVAMTRWRGEMQRARELIERVLRRSDDIVTDDDRVAIADQGVNYIVYSSLTDPGNQSQMAKEFGDEGGKYIAIRALTKGFFYRFCKSLGLVK